jgi:hypothetical protein
MSRSHVAKSIPRQRENFELSHAEFGLVKSQYTPFRLKLYFEGKGLPF